MRLAARVGKTGNGYPVDIHELAIRAIRRKVDQLGLTNVEPLVAVGYRSPVPDHMADMTCASDMFFAIADPAIFLGELKRLTKKTGRLEIDDGQQSRAATKGRLRQGGHRLILEETRDHINCRPT